KLEAEAERLKNEIKENPCKAATKSYILIEIDSETKKESEEAELTLVYHVTGASWMPFYDIRVNTKSDPSEVTIYYYANVQQETGESWKNVELSLSTAQPCNNETLPKLGTTFVEFISFGSIHPPRQQMPQQQSQSGSHPHHLQQMQQQQSQGVNIPPPQHPQRPETPPPPPMKEVVSVAEENILSTTFTVSRKSTIPSDSSKHKVTIGIKKVIAHFHHECAPKKDAKIFLMASVTNTTDYPFLPGIATVYIDNSLSKTFNLKAVSPGDKFDCSLGVDKTVKVIYKSTTKRQHK
uniref:DUF4139 domain-containing protein n=1 Tax=Panagrolaimus sp. ES5 TaxID=591445 RepID=A0AC34GG44_9BILA